MHLAREGQEAAQASGGGRWRCHSAAEEEESVEYAGAGGAGVFRKVVPANDSVSGFFYFEAKPEAGDSLYLSGVRDARPNKELLYYEFSLNAQ